MNIDYSSGALEEHQAMSWLQEGGYALFQLPA
jgi:hypothetical protein